MMKYAGSILLGDGSNKVNIRAFEGSIYIYIYYGAGTNNNRQYGLGGV